MTKTFSIDSILSNECLGSFFLQQDGASCCPLISGKFSFNLENYDYKVFNLKTEKY